MKKQEQKRGWKFAVKLIIIFFLLSFAISFFISLFIEYESASGNIALIPVKGVITIDGSYSFGTQSISSTELIKLIKKADENPSIKAILLDINSRGGSAVASKQIIDIIT